MNIDIVESLGYNCLYLCSYVMFSSVSGIVKEGMKDYNLDTMVRKMIDAIHSTEGVKVIYFN